MKNRYHRAREIAAEKTSRKSNWNGHQYHRCPWQVPLLHDETRITQTLSMGVTFLLLFSSLLAKSYAIYKAS